MDEPQRVEANVVRVRLDCVALAADIQRAGKEAEAADAQVRHAGRREGVLLHACGELHRSTVRVGIAPRLQVDSTWAALVVPFGLRIEELQAAFQVVEVGGRLVLGHLPAATATIARVAEVVRAARVRHDCASKRVPMPDVEHRDRARRVEALVRQGHRAAMVRRPVVDEAARPRVLRVT